MAKSVLETQFRGDDSHFQRAGRRVQQTGQKMHGVVMKLNSAMAALGGGIAISGIVNKFDRMSKIADRLNLTTESVQRLAFAAEQSGSSLQQLQGILTRLQRRVGEALNDPNSAPAKAFRELNMSVEELAQLDAEQMLWAISDAFVATGADEKGLATLMKILDTEVREMIPLLNKGGDSIRAMGDDIKTLSQEDTDELVRMKDNWNALVTDIAAATAGPLADAFKVITEIISGLGIAIRLAGGAIKGAVDPEKTIREGAADAAREIRGEDNWTSTPWNPAPVTGSYGGGSGGRSMGASRSGGFGRTVTRRGAARPDNPTDAASVRLSAAAKSGQSDRDAFFKEARRNMQMTRDDLAAIAGTVETWGATQ